MVVTERLVAAAGELQPTFIVPAAAFVDATTSTGAPPITETVINCVVVPAALVADTTIT